MAASRISASQTASSGSMAYTYDYDVRGNRSAITNAVGHTTSFRYDLIDQLTESVDPEGKATKVLYDKVGNITSVTTPGTRTTSFAYNPNTGLKYLRARYYNPNKGRFFQEDSYLGDISDPLTLNRYAYTKNSPLNYMDPSGHFTAV